MLWILSPGSDDIFYKKVKNKTGKGRAKMSVSLINVINDVDQNFKPVGHCVKVMKDAVEILPDNENIEIMVAKELSASFTKKKIVCLPYKKIHSKNNKKINNLMDFFKQFRNTRYAIKHGKGDKLWFIVALEALFWGIALSNVKNKKIIVTCVHDYEQFLKNTRKFKGIRRWIFKRAYRKINLIIANNPNYIPPCTYVKVPDYYITEQQKEMSKNMKFEKAVCVGQIRQGKDIEGLVEVFKKIDYPLEIIGSFVEEERYENVTKNLTDNITIKNCNLSDEDYYSVLSHAKYAVLPYDMQAYAVQTSGVLLEAVFLGAIPIAPKQLLEYNGIQGLGYTQLSEIPDIIEHSKDDILLKNDLSKFESDNVRGIVRKAFSELK